MKRSVFAFVLLLVIGSQLLVKPTYAIVDPLAVSNNKFGIHIISATQDEIDPAVKLVNSSGGDWGYVTVLIEDKDRDQNKWQGLFNQFREKHLIPIVRIATAPEGDSWKRPYDGEEVAWADFLNNLVWPTKNRYIIVYNEPNHGTEWGGLVDPIDYAKTLDKTITALKAKSDDFFVLNAGLDASAPNQSPSYMDELVYMQQMNQAVPGIFSKLDGWTSHSYPNPGFVGSPDDTGRGSIQTYLWELHSLATLGLDKNLPVFITETGWKHSDGQIADRNFPSSDTVSNYYQVAFNNIWNDNRIVAVTPFLLNYQQPPFDHFSFKKIAGDATNTSVLGATYPDFYPQYQKIMDLAKSSGHPVQENKAVLTSNSIPTQLMINQPATITLTFKNAGQSIWNEYGAVRLVAAQGGNELNVSDSQIPQETKVEPNQEYTFNLSLNPKTTGQFKLTLALFTNGQQFSGETTSFEVNVITPPSDSPSPTPNLSLISQLWKFITSIFNS